MFATYYKILFEYLYKIVFARYLLNINTKKSYL